MPESRYSLGISGKNGLIDKSLGNISVVLDAAVAEEWPPAAHILAVLQVDIYYQALFFLIVSLHKKSCTRQIESKLSLRSFAFSLSQNPYAFC